MERVVRKRDAVFTAASMTRSYHRRNAFRALTTQPFPQQRLYLRPGSTPAGLVAARRPREGVAGARELGREPAARRAGVGVVSGLGGPVGQLVDVERRDARSPTGLAMQLAQVTFQASAVGRRVGEILAERRPASERRGVLVGRKPRQRPCDLLIMKRPRRRNQEVVLVERETRLLALGAALDPGVIQLVCKADALADFDRLVEGGQRGVLQPGVRPCIPKRDQDLDIVGPLRSGAPRTRPRRRSSHQLSGDTSRASRARALDGGTRARQHAARAAPPGCTRRLLRQPQRARRSSRREPRLGDRHSARGHPAPPRLHRGREHRQRAAEAHGQRTHCSE